MDTLLYTPSELKKSFGIEGASTASMPGTAVVECAIKNGFILKGVLPTAVPHEQRDRYFEHLMGLTNRHLEANPGERTWAVFSRTQNNRVVSKLLHEFGVARAAFNDVHVTKVSVASPPPTRITIEELYELVAIRFNYAGSQTAFKRYIQSQYGSYAEYCLLKGYDVNNASWDSPETALRCAKLIGSVARVREKSPSLLSFLEERQLVQVAFPDADLEASQSNLKRR